MRAGDLDEVAVVHTAARSIQCVDLHPHLRRRPVEFGSAARLGAGVEVVDRSSRDQRERVVGTGTLGRWQVWRRLDQRPRPRVEVAVLVGLQRLAGEQILAVRLAVVRRAVEPAVGVETLGALGSVRGARPLHATAGPQQLIRHPAVVAGPARAALTPGFESGFGIRPRGQRLPIPVTEVHPTGVVEKDVEVGSGLAGRIDGLLRQVHGAIGVGERARLLAPASCREDDVGECGRLSREHVLRHEHIVPVEDRADSPQLRQRHGGIRGTDPQHPYRPLLGEAEDLHRVGGRVFMREPVFPDVPQVGQFAHVRVVLPVSEPREIAVGPALPGVLGGGLAVHLQQTATGPPEHPPDEVDVVDLNRRGGRLVRLVEALQHRRHQSFGAAQQTCGVTEIVGRDIADLGDAFRWIVVDHPTQVVETDCVRVDVVVVDPIVGDYFVQQPVHQRDVRAGQRCQMDGGMPGHRRRPRIDADDGRRVGTRESVEDAHPRDALGLGDVVPEQRDGVGMVEVGVGAGLTVAGERGLQRFCGRRSAQPGVAVHVVGADGAVRDDPERVVLLQEELSGRVEADRGGSVFVE